MNPSAILGGLAALAFAFGCGMATNGYMRDAEDNAQLVAAQQAAVEIKEAWNADIARQKQEQADEIASINRRLLDGLDGLRNRPARMPEPARQAAQGATGAELSKPDAEFLERIAAEADEQREALRQCYAWIETVKGE